MHIAVSSESKIVQIPEDGSAVIAGVWIPDYSSEFKGQYLLKWQNERITSLTALQPCRAESQRIGIGLTGEDLSGTHSSDEILFDWSEYTLMPGFLDAHVHLALDSIDFNQCLANWDKPSLIETNMQDFAKSYLEAGIVAIRDGGDLPGYAWQAKKSIAERKWIGPQVISVREAVARQGMYGRFLGRGFVDIQDWRSAEDDFFGHGLDQLKVIVTGIIRFDQYGVVGPVQWTVEELKKLTDAAHQRGKKVMAHASGANGIEVAIEAGVDSIEHGYYMTTEQLKRLRDQGIAWVPTVAPVGNLLKYPTERYSALEREILSKIIQNHLERIQEAYQLKVLLGIGTDAGAYLVPHGRAFYDEIEWFSVAGIPKEDIYRIATIGNAQICGLSEHGRITVGTPMHQLQLVKSLKF